MKEIIKDIAIRTIKTMAQSLAGGLASASILADVNWRIALSATAMSGILCILMNIQRIGDDKK